MAEPTRADFTISEMNTIPYWREVKKCLARNCEFKNPSPQIIHSLHRTWENGGKERCRWPKPRFDAICLLLKKRRIVFDEDGFFERYPSTKEMIKDFRQKIGLKA